MKRRIIDILSILLIIAVLVSCQNKDINSTIVTTTENPAMTAPSVDNLVELLPTLDYGGYVFKIWGANFISSAASAQQVPVTEFSGDTVNDSLIQRDMIVEEKYNITVEYRLIERASDIVSEIGKTVLSGDDAVDMFYGDLVSTIPPLMQQGALIDFNKVPNIDLDNKWWSQYAREGMTIAGRYYFPMGDITPRLYSSPYLILFNKNLISNYSLESPYKFVMSGNWTLDKMANMGKNVTADLNGDGVFDMNDRFGHVYENWSSFCYYVGCGQRMTSKDGNELKLLIAQPESISIIDKIHSYLTDSSQSFNAQNVGAENFHAMFENSQALFFNIVISTVPSFRNMDVDFGILPSPKFDDAQENYYACAQPWAAGAAGVPQSVTDLERCGMLIEALGAAAKYTSTPAYFELTLKTKISRDSESSEMLDIIFSNIHCDLGYSFNWAKSRDILRDSMITNSIQIVSEYASIEEIAAQEITKMIETVKNLP